MGGSGLSGLGGGPPGSRASIANFKSHKAVKVIRPFLADLSHLLNLCVIGCSCIDRSTIEAGGFGGNNGPAEQVAMTMLRGGGTLKGDGNAATHGLPGRLEISGNLGGLGESQAGGGGGENDDGLRKLSGAFWAVIKAMTLEVKHFYHNLRVQYILPSILRTSDMPHCAEVLIVVVYLRAAWNHIMHRLELTMSRYQLDEHLANAFSSMVWRISAMLDEMVSSLQARVVNLNLHWSKVYLLQDISVQDWQSPQVCMYVCIYVCMYVCPEVLHYIIIILSLSSYIHTQPFMQDRRCTYGVLAWSLFMRGLFFDFRNALLHQSSAPETREIISAILAGSLSALTTRYLAIRPSRARLGQYTSDICCILVTSLTLSLLLSDDGAYSLRHSTS